MAPDNLEEVLASVENPVEHFRNLDPGESIWSFPDEPFSWPDEYTNWIEEMRAWRESCILADQSYHMLNIYFEGPDAIELFSDLGVNNFESFRNSAPPQAKQFVAATHEGEMIGDCVLFYLEEETFLTVGTALAQNWLRYNVDTGDYDVSMDLAYHPIEPGEPRDFRFEIQGPKATAVIEEIVDGPAPEVSFFGMDEISVGGVEVYALGHGMAGEPGLEIFGPYEHHDELRELILEVGEEYGIRQLGSKSYKNANIESGWLPHYLPGIYESDEMRGYREWLPADGYEATVSVGGSFDADEISEYYIDPVELGYGKLIDFDHDFVGKEALREKVENQQRTKVTLVWDADDVIDVYASLFREGDTYRYIDFPDTAMSRSDTNYDKLLKGGEVVGVSKTPGYIYPERSMLSLGVVDLEYAEPGTEVTLVWGEDTEKRVIERHVQKEITATVAPVPFVEGREDL